MSDKGRERFGRYLIMDHLVDGGMAKICRARYLGEQADKVVAIKMVQPQFSKDESFKTMFMDEIRMTFGLIHPNIIQTYDYGLHKEQLYVAMEYCDGRNLKEYLDKLKKRKFVFPVEISAYIITQVCQGLHYAHTFTDKLTGKKTNIIHRDISPHNIMLTYDGAVKVIDFGIAKSETNSEATQAGTIKGKLSYLAPEYLEGLKLDPRYDEFAVGITLWEMLCSRKLFKANNDLAVLKKIQECKVPAPSTINPNVPKELDQIVMKALSKDRNIRYENLDQLNRALMKFLYTHYPDFNATDLSYFAKELFKDEIRKDRDKMVEFGKIDLGPFINAWKEESNGHAPAADSTPRADGDITESRIKKSQVLDFGFSEEDNSDKNKSILNKSKNDDNGLALEGTIKDKTVKNIKRPTESELAMDTSIKDDLVIGNTRPKKVQSATARTGATTTNIKKKKPEKTVVKKSSGFDIKKIVAMFAIIVFGGYLLMPSSEKEAVITNDDIIDESFNESEEVIERVPTSNTIEKTMVKVLNFDKYNKNNAIYVNGKKTKLGIMGEIEVDSNVENVLRFEIRGKKNHVVKFTPTDSEVTIKVPSPGDLDDARYFYLKMSKSCISSGQLFLNVHGEDRVEKLPFLGKSLRIPVNVDPETQQILETDYTWKIKYLTGEQETEGLISFKESKEEIEVDLCKKIEKL